MRKIILGQVFFIGHPFNKIRKMVYCMYLYVVKPDFFINDLKLQNT